MVPVTSVQNDFLHFRWDRADDVEWGLCVVRFPASGFIQLMKINGSSGCAVLLWNNDHTGAPRGWMSWGHRFDYTECDVRVKLGFYVVFPMMRNRNRGVNGFSRMIWQERNLKRSAGHHLEFLVLAYVKRATCVIILNPFLNV